MMYRQENILIRVFHARAVYSDDSMSQTDLKSKTSKGLNNLMLIIPCTIRFRVTSGL